MELLAAMDRIPLGKISVKGMTWFQALAYIDSRLDQESAQDHIIITVEMTPSSLADLGRMREPTLDRPGFFGNAYGEMQLQTGETIDDLLAHMTLRDFFWAVTTTYNLSVELRGNCARVLYGIGLVDGRTFGFSRQFSEYLGDRRKRAGFDPNAFFFDSERAIEDLGVPRPTPEAQ
jgi:hypothetical protein